MEIDQVEEYQGLQEERGFTLAELEQGHFLPMDASETLDDFEERMAQGLSCALEAERPQAEERMLDLILQGYFQAEPSAKDLQWLRFEPFLRPWDAR